MMVRKIAAGYTVSTEMLAMVTAYEEFDRAVLAAMGEAADRAILRAFGELASYVHPEMSVWENEGGAL